MMQALFDRLNVICRDHLKACPVHQQQQPRKGEQRPAKAVRGSYAKEGLPAQAVELYNEFFLDLSSIMPVFCNVQYSGEDATACKCNFAALFHHRMLSANCTLLPTQIVCYQHLMERYMELVSEYVRGFEEDERERLMQKFDANIKMARGLLDYCDTHFEDPDGAIMGLTPSDRVLKEYKGILDTLVKRQGERSDHLFVQDTKQGVTRLTTKCRNNKSFQPPVNCLSISHPRRKDIVNAIIEMSTLPREKMLEEIESYGNLFEAELLLTEMWKKFELRAGDIVIAVLFEDQLATVKKMQKRRAKMVRQVSKRTRRVLSKRSLDADMKGGEETTGKKSLSDTGAPSQDSFEIEKEEEEERDPWLHLRISEVPIIFCRFIKASNDTVYLFTNPDEREVVAVAWWQVTPVNDELKNMLGSTRAMSAMVQSPVDMLYRWLTQYVKDRTFEYMEKAMGIEEEVIVRMTGNETTITDLTKLKHAKAELEKLVQNPPDSYKEFLKDIGEFTSREVKSFRETFPPTEIFAPSREDSLSGVESFDFCSLTQSRIVRYIGMCEFALGQLQLDKKFLMSGSQKQQMTEWWLDLIETRVDEFLDMKGYKRNIIPDNYIDEPPSSMNALKENLRLLQEIMNPKEDMHGTQEFVKSLKDEIYPRIHTFLQNGRIALCEHFNQNENDFNLEMIGRVFESEKSHLDPKIRTWIDDMIKDMEYLEQIIEAEENPRTGGGLELGPVPISGLIVGYFFRLENEHTTVMDVWRHLDPAYQQKQKDAALANSSGELKAAVENVGTTTGENTENMEAASPRPDSEASVSGAEGGQEVVEAGDGDALVENSSLSAGSAIKYSSSADMISEKAGDCDYQTFSFDPDEVQQTPSEDATLSGRQSGGEEQVGGEEEGEFVDEEGSGSRKILKIGAARKAE